MIAEARRNAAALAASVQTTWGHIVNTAMGGPVTYENLFPVVSAAAADSQHHYAIFEQRVAQWNAARNYNPAFLVTVHIAATGLKDRVTDVVRLSKTQYWPTPQRAYAELLRFLNSIRDPYNVGGIPELPGLDKKLPIA